MMKLRLLTALTLSLALTAGASAQPLAEKLPARTLIYAGWDPTGEAFAQTKLGTFLAEPESQLMARQFTRIMEKQSMPDQAKSGFRSMFQMMVEASRGPVAFALIDFPDFKKAEQMPKLALIADLGDRAEKVQDHLKKMMKSLQTGGGPISDFTIAGVTLQGMRDQALFGVHENHLYFFMGTGTAREVLELKASESLAQDEAFPVGMQSAGTQDLVLALYSRGTQVYLDKAMTVVESFDPDQAAKVREEAEHILEGLGINQAKSLALTIRAVEGRLLSTIRIDSPAPHNGILAAFAGEPLGPDALADVPADAILASAANVDSIKMLLQVERFARAFPQTQARGGLDADFNDFEKATGVHPLNDIYTNIGDSWNLSLSPSRGGVCGGLLVSVETKNPQAISDSLDKIGKAMEESFAQRNAKIQDRWLRSDLLPGIQTATSGQGDIQYLAWRSRYGALPIAPAWRIRDSRLQVALWPQVLQATDREDGEKLTEKELYRKMHGRVARGASILAYADQKELLKQAYPWSLMLWSYVSNMAAGEEGVELPITWLPDFQRLGRLAGPAMLAAGADEKGVFLRCEGDLPPLDLPICLAAATVPPVAAGLGPAVSYVNTWGDLSRTRSNLFTIGIALLSPAQTKLRQLPENMAMVAERNGTYVLISPFSDKAAPCLEDGKLQGEIDYIYRRPAGGKLTDIEDPAQYVLVYEKPENYRNRGTFVFFADRRVEWVDKEQLDKLLQK